MRIGAVLLALVISAHGGQNEPVLDLATERQTFADALRTFRRGDDSALTSLEASAERMAKLKREDARDVVAFYRDLSPEDRRAGLEAEERYEALWAEVRAAEKKGPADWPSRREQIDAELMALIGTRRASPDPTPAARALALSALLVEQRAREDTRLTPDERERMLADVQARAREALAIFSRAGFVTPTLEPLWLLARVEDARGTAFAAREGFEECLELAEQVESDAYRWRALRGLFGAAEAEGDRREQREILRQMASIRAPADDWWLAHRWGALLLSEDEPEAARSFLEANQPLQTSEKSQWHFLYGTALQRQGNVEEAERHFREVRLERKPDTGFGADCAEAQAGVWRAQAALERGEAARALEIAAPLADVACEASTRAWCAYTIGAAHLKLGQFALAETVLRSALEQGEAIESRLARSEGGSVFGEVVGLETVALLAEALSQQGRHLEAVRVAEEAQARALRGQDVELTDLDVRAWAAAFERGLLTWVVGADTTVCSHVSSDGTTVTVSVALGREALHTAVRRVREAATSGDEARARRLAKEVEARVLPGVLRERSAGAGRLLILAHGPLERMPFDLMPLAELGPIAVLPGLAEARPRAALAASSLANWSIFGDPSSDDGASVLPGARTEVEALAQLVGETALTGDAFDRLTLIEALKTGRSLHVATHLVRGCGAEGAGGEAGLLLARGDVFCAREIRELGPRLPIAVLAACETAQGHFNDSQALESVSNAFLGSGTRNLCVTLWPIEDAAARHWSETFHRSLKSGARPSEAAFAARERLRRDGMSVSEWAAFRFAGRD